MTSDTPNLTSRLAKEIAFETRRLEIGQERNLPEVIAKAQARIAQYEAMLERN